MTSPHAVAAGPVRAILSEDLGAGGVLRLTLNRPKERNALSRDLLAALLQAIEQAAADEAVRAAPTPRRRTKHDMICARSPPIAAIPMADAGSTKSSSLPAPG